MIAFGALAGVGMGAIPAEARGHRGGGDSTVNTYFGPCGYNTDWKCVATAAANGQTLYFHP